MDFRTQVSEQWIPLSWCTWGLSFDPGSLMVDVMATACVVKYSDVLENRKLTIWRPSGTVGPKIACAAALTSWNLQGSQRSHREFPCFPQMSLQPSGEAPHTASSPPQPDQPAVPHSDGPTLPSEEEVHHILPTSQSHPSTGSATHLSPACVVSPTAPSGSLSTQGQPLHDPAWSEVSCPGL